jgi:hypothetical protein
LLYKFKKGLGIYGKISTLKKAMAAICKAKCPAFDTADRQQAEPSAQSLNLYLATIQQDIGSPI